MRLIRISAGKSPSRRFTQRNLYSVMQYVDSENPLKSKLLTAASGPHGTVQNAIFSEHEASRYKRLVDWVVQITGRELPQTPATVEPAAPAVAAEPTLTEPPPGVLPTEARKARRLPPSDHGPKDASHRPNHSSSPTDHPAAEPSDPKVPKGRRAPEKPAAEN